MSTWVKTRTHTQTHTQEHIKCTWSHGRWFGEDANNLLHCSAQQTVCVCVDEKGNNPEKKRTFAIICVCVWVSSTLLWWDTFFWDCDVCVCASIKKKRKRKQFFFFTGGGEEKKQNMKTCIDSLESTFMAVMNSRSAVLKGQKKAITAERPSRLWPRERERER